MSDEGEQIHVEHQSNAGKWLLTLLAVAFVAVSGYTHYVMHTTVQKLTQDLAASQAQVKELQQRMENAEAQEETLARQAGMTKKELAQRAAELQAQQRAAETRLEAEQKQQITAVSGDIAGVKTDVGGVKTDVAATKADLEATKGAMTSMKGDLGVQSGLIARNHDEVEELKRLGERDIFEFTLNRSAKAPEHVGPIQMQLKKTDTKKYKFTLNVVADDKNIEKKDKTVGEPVQFYVRGARAPYEIVVFDVTKDTAKGYLSAPKSATAAPPSTPPGN